MFVVKGIVTIVSRIKKINRAVHRKENFFQIFKDQEEFLLCLILEEEEEEEGINIHVSYSRYNSLVDQIFIRSIK